MSIEHPKQPGPVPRPDDLLTVKEAATLLRRCERQLRRWRARGDGPAFIRLDAETDPRGDRVFYRRADIAAWLDRQVLRPVPPPPG